MNIILISPAFHSICIQEYTRAYNAYSAALQLSPVGPSSHVFLSNRAASLLSLKRYSAAAVDARRAVALAPTFGKAHARLGQALYFLKQYQGAVEAYEDALKYEEEGSGSNGAVTRAYLIKAKEKMALQEEKERRRALAAGGDDGGTVGDESAFQTIAYSVVTDKEGKGVASGMMTSRRLNEVAKDEKDKQMSSITEDKEVENAPRGSPTSPYDKPAKRASPTMMYVETGPMGGPAQRRVDQPQDRGIGSSDNQTGEFLGNEEPDPDFDEALRLQRRATQYLSHKKYRHAVDDFSAALFLVPDDPILTPQLHVGRAHALNGQERFESAKNDALMALRHIIKNGEEDVSAAEAYSVLGKSLYYTKDYHGAIEALEECDRVWKLNGGKLSVFDEAYLEQCHEALDAGLGNDHADGASLGGGASVVSNGVKSVVSTLKEGKPLTNIPKLKPPRFVSREQALQNAHNIPPMPKNWPQQTPTSPSSIATGPERVVTFLSDAMGIKLNRGNDGLIRVISVADLPPGSPILRKGKIETGDLVREAGGVDLRRPITATMWGDTVALIKMAPRPLVMIVAKEITSELISKSPRTNQQKFEFPSAANGEEPVAENAFTQSRFVPPSLASGEDAVKLPHDIGGAEYVHHE
jgi:tetratricopeptide (TPR) repeat protein